MGSEIEYKIFYLTNLEIVNSDAATCASFPDNHEVRGLLLHLHHLLLEGVPCLDRDVPLNVRLGLQSYGGVKLGSITLQEAPQTLLKAGHPGINGILNADIINIIPDDIILYSSGYELSILTSDRR